MNRKNKKIFRAVCLSHIFIGAIFLVGCASAPKTPPQKLLGITDAEWLSYDKNKQNELLQTYQQIDLANKTEDQQKAQELALQGNVSSEKVIKVNVYDGSALMSPFVSWQAFTPAVFSIREGTCQNVSLTQIDGSTTTSLRSCYKDKLLHLDPSHYELDKQAGTASIPYSPLWDQGFVYHNINSYGYVKLKNATIAIKQD